MAYIFGERDAENTREANERADNWEAGIAAEWPHRVRDNGQWEKDYLLVSKDQRRLRQLKLQIRPKVEIKSDAEVDMADVMSVEIFQETKVVSKSKTTSTTTKQAPIARAIIGGVLFGGAGAVVRAVSAGSQTTSSSEGFSKKVAGPAYVVIGTSDFEHPVLKAKMADADIAELWMNRIRGAAEKARRG